MLWLWPVPSPLWALGLPNCQMTRLDRDPRKALPTCKCQVRVSGPFPEVSLSHLSFSHRAGWSQLWATFPSFDGGLPGSRLGVWVSACGQGEVQALGIFSLVLSPLALPHMLSPGPDACGSQGGRRGAPSLLPQLQRKCYQEQGSGPSSWTWTDEKLSTLPGGFLFYFPLGCNLQCNPATMTF